MGPSLEKLFNHCKRKFSLETVLMIGDEMLSIVQYLHNEGFIHRDLKPDNFVVGYNNHAKIYLIDFGLALSYMQHNNNGGVEHM